MTSTLLINDTTNVGHWGCYATSRALSRNLEARGHTVTPLTLPLDLPLLDGALSSPAHFREPTLLDELDARVPNLIASVRNAENICVNGEGTLHGIYDRPRYLYALIAAAHHFGKPIALINCSIFPESNPTGDAPAQYALHAEVLRHVSFIACRDAFSHAVCHAMGLPATRSFDCLPIEAADHTPATEAQRQGIVLTGSVLQHPELLNAFEALARKFEADITLLLDKPKPQRADSDQHVADHLDRAGLAIRTIRAHSFEEWLHTLASGRVVVSGRFHHAMAARVVGTPVVTIASNTPKLDALAELGAPAPLNPMDPKLPEQLIQAAAATLEAPPPPNNLDAVLGLAQRNFAWLDEPAALHTDPPTFKLPQRVEAAAATANQRVPSPNRIPSKTRPS
ncbi:MAG: polysaccharide pyruvyl transferase family protein [Planctomycetota bacterium]